LIDRKSDQVDAEKLTRYARLDPNILRPISHRTVEQQETLTLIRARELLVRLRTAFCADSSWQTSTVTCARHHFHRQQSKPSRNLKPLKTNWLPYPPVGRFATSRP
jgi:transposase